MLLVLYALWFYYTIVLFSSLLLAPSIILKLNLIGRSSQVLKVTCGYASLFQPSTRTTPISLSLSYLIPPTIQHPSRGLHILPKTMDGKLWLIFALLGYIALFYIAVYRALFAPLSKIPGPRYALFTDWWLMYKEFTSQRRLYIHECHRKYGSVVRLGPNEVAFTSGEAVKEIYMSGGSGYDKTEFYTLFKQFDTRTMFSTLFKGDVSSSSLFLLWVGQEAESVNGLMRCSIVKRNDILLGSMPIPVLCNRRSWMGFGIEQMRLWRSVLSRKERVWILTSICTALHLIAHRTFSSIRTALIQSSVKQILK